MDSMIRRIVSICSLAAVVGAMLATTAGPAPAKAPTAAPPNVILVVTDDQRWDTAAEMDRVQSDLVARGVNFTNARATTPLCARRGHRS
jgi:hypothetical protein